MAFYSYLSTKIIMAFITKSYQNLFGVRSYINARNKIAYNFFMFFCLYGFKILSSISFCCN